MKTKEENAFQQGCFVEVHAVVKIKVNMKKMTEMLIAVRVLI